MDDLSPSARAALRTYQAAAGLGPAAHARVQQRLDESLDALEAPPVARRRPIAVISLITAIAAAALFAVCDLRQALTESRRVDAGAASHDAPPAPPHTADVQAPARTPAASPPASPPATPRPPRVPAHTPTPAERGLAAEVAYMREARAALDRGDPASALHPLDAHAQEFPAGQMLEDRERLRIEALCALGRGDEARAEIDAFLRDHPSSTHTARVRGLCPGP